MDQAEIITLLATYKYTILFPLLVLQGPIVALVAGALATSGLFKLTTLCVAVIIADLVTDTIIYSIGRWGRETLVERFGTYVRLTKERIEKAEMMMEEHGTYALAVAKVAYTTGTPMMLLCGMTRMPYLKFIFINILVGVPKSILLVLLGYFLGSQIPAIIKYLNYVGVGILVIGIAIGIWIYKRKKS